MKQLPEQTASFFVHSQINLQTIHFCQNDFDGEVVRTNSPGSGTPQKPQSAATRSCIPIKMAPMTITQREREREREYGVWQPPMIEATRWSRALLTSVGTAVSWRMSNNVDDAQAVRHLKV